MKKVLNLNQVEFAIDDAGSGPTVILIHAGVADHRMWEPQYAWLQKSYRAVRWDMRGFGDSTLVNGSFSNTSDSLAIMDALQIDRAIIIGCSMGGAIALRIAIQHPDKVAGLVLIGSDLYGYPAVHPWPLEAEIMDAIGQNDIEHYLDLVVKAWYVGTDRSADEVDDHFLDLGRAMIRQTLVHDGVQATDVDEETSDAGAIGQLTTPTLLVTGNKDAARILEIADYITRTIPSITSVIMEDTAHLPSLEKPEEFNQILSDWLKKMR